MEKLLGSTEPVLLAEEQLPPTAVTLLKTSDFLCSQVFKREIWQLKRWMKRDVSSVPITFFTSGSRNCQAETSLFPESLSRSKRMLFRFVTAVDVWFWSNLVRLSKLSAKKTDVWRWICSYCIHLFLIILESLANLWLLYGCKKYKRSYCPSITSFVMLFTFTLPGLWMKKHRTIHWTVESIH